VGTRRVRVSVRDPDYEDRVNLTFVIENANDAPTAYMEYPSGNGSYDNVTPIHFSAWGSFDPDSQWGDVLNYTWESNGTDLIGYGEELNATLTPGTHSVTLIVRDLEGAFDTVSVELSVKAVEPSQPPVQPPDGKPRKPWWREQFVPAGIGAIIVLALVAAAMAARRKVARAAEAPAERPARPRPRKHRPAPGKAPPGQAPPPAQPGDDEPCGEAEEALDVDALEEENA
jgi:hypothetical protein